MNLRGRSFSGGIMGLEEGFQDMTEKLQQEAAEAQGYGKQWLENKWQQNQKSLELAASEFGQDVVSASMESAATTHGEAVGESLWDGAKPWVIGGGAILLALVGYGVYKMRS